jgi:hypothetical protein
MGVMGAWVSRRGTVVGAVVALTLVAAMSLAARAGAQTAGDGLIPEGDWTEAEVAYLVDLVHRTEAALPARFPSVATEDELADVLGDMGFHDFGATAPGGYDHWINNGWLVDDHVVDPQYPEALVYQLQEDGSWHLVAAMFMLDPAIDMESIPADIAWLPGWQGHPELCVDDADGTFVGLTDADNPSCPAGSHSAATPQMTHVWIVDNACGHRFGGVGVEGLHCDVDDHDADDHDGDDHDADDHSGNDDDHDTDDHDGNDHGGGDHDGNDHGGGDHDGNDHDHGGGDHSPDGSHDQGDAHGGGHDMAPSAPPARPVIAEPSFIG